MKTAKQNWFNTLNEALASEGLLHTRDMTWSPIGYNEYCVYHHDEGKYQRRISISRDSNGMYERPVHYLCK